MDLREATNFHYAAESTHPPEAEAEERPVKAARFIAFRPTIGPEWRCF